jgi:anaerobic ribonucleoside-triphosphate reductase activating protein
MNRMHELGNTRMNSPSFSEARPMTDLLHIAELSFDVLSLGPGKRIVLWVQGCCFSCPGCSSREWQSIGKGTPWSIGTLADHILHNADDTTEGATFSGGEPMLQAGGLRVLWNALKGKRPHWTLIVYTGFTLDEIASNGKQAQVGLSRAADVLIDGRYIDSLNDGRGLRGSSNQRIIFGSDRYRGKEQHFRDGDRTLEIEFRDDRALITGMAPRGMYQTLDEALFRGLRGILSP